MRDTITTAESGSTRRVGNFGGDVIPTSSLHCIITISRISLEIRFAI